MPLKAFVLRVAGKKNIFSQLYDDGTWLMHCFTSADNAEHYRSTNAGQISKVIPANALQVESYTVPSDIRYVLLDGRGYDTHTGETVKVSR